MLIITAPGQGAQTPGFLAPWLELPGVADRLGAASELAGRDLIRLGTTGERRRDQGHRGSAAAARRGPRIAAAGDCRAGPRGEVPADVGRRAQRRRAGGGGPCRRDRRRRRHAPGRVRGAAMAAAAAAEPTGMTAVLGGDEDAVLAAIARYGLTPGERQRRGTDRGRGDDGRPGGLRGRPAAGARLRPLQVAGAFHTRHMAPAVAALRDAAAGVSGQGPGNHAAVQRGRRRGHHRQGMAGAASSPRSPRRCAGTCACARWPISA